MAVMTVDELTSYIGGAHGCCLDDAEWTRLGLDGGIAEVVAASIESGWGPEHNLTALAVLSDGRAVVLEEWEDTSGHG